MLRFAKLVSLAIEVTELPLSESFSSAKDSLPARSTIVIIEEVILSGSPGTGVYVSILSLNIVLALAALSIGLTYPNCLLMSPILMSENI